MGATFRRLPSRTTVIYAGTASTWVVGSDVVLTLIRGTTFGGFAANAVKGLLFVALSSTVLFVVLRWWSARVLLGWEAATREQARFEALVERTDDLIGVLDEDGRFSYVSPSMERILGWQTGDMIGTQGRVFIHPDEVGDAVEALTAVRGGRNPMRPQAFRMLTPDGRWRHIEFLADDLRHEPSVNGVVVHGRDVTDRFLAETRLQHALAHDAITGLPNRARFEDDLRDAAFAAFARSHQLLVLVVDILSFRDVNGAVGRTGGDDVLRQIAQRLQDHAGVTALARLGADEFAIALPVRTGASNAEKEALLMARRLNDVVGPPFTVGEQRFHLSSHVGGTVVSLPGPVERALLTAESNLRLAKLHPDGVVVSALSPNAGIGQTGAVLAGSLHDALESDELVLHYQPQYELATGEVVGLEALIRWQHPTEGLLAPHAFLAEATRGTLLPLVTRFVLSTATRQAAAWATEGRPVTMSVNLSLGDLRRQSLVEEVLSAVNDSGLDPSLLRLELTEQTLLAEPERSIRAIRSLQDAGIEFSIDDFGTGYSSLVHLRTLSVQELKIDRVFIAGMAEGGVDDAIVNAVMDLGHRTHLSIVAEGIEDVQTYRLLASRGCDRGQGYLMSRAVPADEVPFERFEPAERPYPR